MGNQIIQSIKTIAQSLVDKAGYDKTRGGVIVGVNSTTNTYSVKVDGVTYPIVRAVDGATYNVGDVVKVVIPCNQATQMYIASSVLSDNSLGNKIANAVGLAQEAKQLGLENQADVANAAKVATNFINYDSTNGLIIGNKTSGSWSGYRSQILPGSFNVLDASSTVLASFGPTTVIGEEANANIHLTFNNLSMIDRDGTKFFEVGDNRNAEGIATVKHTAIVSVGSSGSATVTVNSNISSIVSVYADSVQLSSSSYSFSQKDVTINGLTANSQTSIEITYTTTESTVYLTFGERDSSANIGNYSAAEGYNVISSGYCSHAEGEATTASGLNSHAEGYRTTASGYCSHAEGCRTIASGPYSHAEGNKTIAKGLYSHAEGEWTEAIDSNSHAEGYNTTAKGHCSHAEGAHTVASGMHSHAAGYMTVADSNYMTAIGQYNTRNSGKAFVIGNGEDDKHRSDAFTVSWAGSVGIAYNIFMELGDCYVRDNTFDKTLSVIDGASTLDGLVAQSIINTFSYADAIEILGEEITGRNANINVKKLLQKIVEKIGKR